MTIANVVSTSNRPSLIDFEAVVSAEWVAHAAHGIAMSPDAESMRPIGFVAAMTACSAVMTAGLTMAARADRHPGRRGLPDKPRPGLKRGLIFTVSFSRATPRVAMPGSKQPSNGVSGSPLSNVTTTRSRAAIVSLASRAAPDTAQLEAVERPASSWISRVLSLRLNDNPARVALQPVDTQRFP